MGGGVRSGKSRYALSRAYAAGPRRVFVATAQALDGEMADRIAAHQGERGDDFETIEAPDNLVGALKAAMGDTRHGEGADGGVPPDVIVVDCLTLWLSNLLLAKCGTKPLDRAACRRLVDSLREDIHTLATLLTELTSQHPTEILLVTNEVGLGIVPEHALGRVFRDVAGICHQQLAGIADEVYAGVMGMLLKLKPGPVTAVPAADI